MLVTLAMSASLYVPFLRFTKEVFRRNGDNTEDRSGGRSRSPSADVLGDPQGDLGLRRKTGGRVALPRWGGVGDGHRVPAGGGAPGPAVSRADQAGAWLRAPTRARHPAAAEPRARGRLNHRQDTVISWSSRPTSRP